MSSSILNLFLQGDGMSGACSGSIESWLCIAVPQRSAHFPNYNHDLENPSQINELEKKAARRKERFCDYEKDIVMSLATNRWRICRAATILL